MNLTRILFLLGIVFFVQVGYVQAQDEDIQRDGRKRNKVYVQKKQKSSKVKHSKDQKDLFRNETFKSTAPSKKQQQKAMVKKTKNQAKKYKQTRKTLQNKETAKRMKKNQRMSKKMKNRKASYAKRFGNKNTYNNKKIRAATSKRSGELRKREDKAREKYESKYIPPSGQKKKKKIR